MAVGEGGDEEEREVVQSKECITNIFFSSLVHFFRSEQTKMMLFPIH